MEPIFKHDCAHFPGDKPCLFHKREGRVCDVCKDYLPRTLRVLIVKLAAMGDVLRTTFLLGCIKRDFPNATVTWVTMGKNIPLLENNPSIHHIFSIEGEAMARLHVEEFDLILSPDANSWSAALASMAKGNQRRGFFLNSKGVVEPTHEKGWLWYRMGAFDHEKKKNQKSYQEMVSGSLGLSYELDEIQYFPKKSELIEAKDFINQYQKTEQKIIGVNLGGGDRWKKKVWKAKHFVSYIHQMVDSYQVLPILIAGESERFLYEEVTLQLNGINYVPGIGLGIRQTAALIHYCDLFLTADSLAMHLASALKVHQIVLFGPTSLAEIEMYGRGVKLASQIECLGCYLTNCDKTPDCMSLIDPQWVIRESERLLSESFT